MTEAEMDAIDIRIARDRLAELEADPSLLISGAELERRMAEWADHQTLFVPLEEVDAYRAAGWNVRPLRGHHGIWSALAWRISSLDKDGQDRATALPADRA